MDSTVTFGGASNYIQISGGKRNSKTGITSASISRIMQKDITVGSVTERRSLSCQLVIQAADGFTTTEVDALVLTISDFVTTANLERILQGEQ